MKLIQSLRDHLLAKVPHLGNNPDRLLISVEKGKMEWEGLGLSHRQDYVATIELDSWPEGLDTNNFFVPLLDWYQQNQDPRPPKTDSPISYETHILSNDTTTVVVMVLLQEMVVARSLPNGSYEFNVCSV